MYSSHIFIPSGSQWNTNEYDCGGSARTVAWAILSVSQSVLSSGDCWMHLYQRTSMGNPYISPIEWVNLSVTIPKNPIREHHKNSHGIFRGTPKKSPKKHINIIESDMSTSIWRSSGASRGCRQPKRLWPTCWIYGLQKLDPHCLREATGWVGT